MISPLKTAFCLRGLLYCPRRIKEWHHQRTALHMKGQRKAKFTMFIRLPVLGCDVCLHHTVQVEEQSRRKILQSGRKWRGSVYIQLQEDCNHSRWLLQILRPGQCKGTVILCLALSYVNRRQVLYSPAYYIHKTSQNATHWNKAVQCQIEISAHIVFSWTFSNRRSLVVKARQVGRNQHLLKLDPSTAKTQEPHNTQHWLENYGCLLAGWSTELWSTSHRDSQESSSQAGLVLQHESKGQRPLHADMPVQVCLLGSHTTKRAILQKAATATLGDGYQCRKMIEAEAKTTAK